MTSRSLFIVIAVFLAVAAVAAPVLLTGVPWPVRAATSVSSLLGAFALAMAARQSR